MSRYDPLTRAAALVTGDIDSARDCVQEAFLRLCRDWDRVKGYDHLDLWVRQVAVNLARDHRRTVRRRALLLTRLEVSGTAPPAPDGDPELWAAVRGLPNKQRVALALHYLAGLKISEVSAAMAISEGAVKKHLDRARTTLRRNLEVER